MARAGTLSFDDHEVSTLVARPRGAIAMYVLAHGAGAPMTHPFLESIADALAARRIATLRFNFPYTEAGKKRPDSPALLSSTIHAAVASARRSKLPLFVGGKSMGGRIASQCAARGELDDARGLIFLGFPLHAAKRPSSERATHLRAIEVPMLFLQGTRDALADLALLRPIVKSLPRATLHEVDEGDHSFVVPKRIGRTAEEVHAELADAIEAFVRGVLR